MRTSTSIALLIAIAPMIAPMTARADKLFTKGQGTTWDCRKDPRVDIKHGLGTYTFTGKCATINVDGFENQLTIESVDMLTVNGSMNTVTVGTVDEVSVTGGDNKVTYQTAKSGKVTANTMGAENTIEQAR
jgi:DUF3060 family protein